MVVTISAAAAHVIQRTPRLLVRLNLATVTAIRRGHFLAGRWHFQLPAGDAVRLRDSLNVEADARRPSDAPTGRLLDGAAADITAAMIFEKL
jgi:hypothetical protein